MSFFSHWIRQLTQFLSFDCFIFLLRYAEKLIIVSDTVLCRAQKMLSTHLISDASFSDGIFNETGLSFMLNISILGGLGLNKKRKLHALECCKRNRFLKECCSLLI